ncbi:hypothetical protein UlMin_040978 [Ulmus minor]
MRGKRVFNDSRPRGCSEKKTVKKGKVKENHENVVVIDLDGDNVVIIDGTEPSEQEVEASRVLKEDRNFSTPGIINIDDDEDNNGDPGVSVEAGGDLDSDASSSRSQFPAFSDMRSHVNLDTDECQIVQEKTSAFQFSKCKQTYCTKVPGRNRYGLDPDTDICFTDSDSSDCELVEDSLGKLREEWEKASLKRKHVFKNRRHSGSDDQGSPSGSNSEAHTSAEVSDREQEVPVCSNSSNSDYGKENLPEFNATCKGCPESTSFKIQPENSFADADQKVEVESSPIQIPVSVQEKESLHQNADFPPAGGTVTEDSPCSFDFEHQKDKVFSACDSWNWNEHCAQGSAKGSDQNVCDEQSKHKRTCSMDDEHKDDYDCFPGYWYEDEPSPEGSPELSEQELGDEQSKRTSKDDYHCFPGYWNEDEPSPQGSPKLSEQELSDEQSKHTSNEQPGFGNSVSKNDNVQDEEASLHKNPCQGVNHGNYDGDIFKETRDEFSEVPSSFDTSAEKCEKNTSFEGREKPDAGQLFETNSRVCGETQVDNGVAQALDGDVTPVERCIINDREKLKETDEYKRAKEEEWAARQRELQRQQEEVQNLRKRKKAESREKQRLLDMQKRQKQRVQEVRETQKKDKENINMKEQIRHEISKELQALEMRCVDMASLLRGLGIPVGVGFHPTPQEVHSAYKRAVLKFHPDRASRTDVRQQVESEEKFKLISRMKEKFLLTSC